MSEKHIKRVLDLLDRAGHLQTPVHEAVTCARLALRIIREKELTVTEKKKGLKDTYNEDPTNRWWEHGDVGKTIILFRCQPATSQGVCKACGAIYNKHEMVAATASEGTTHYKCRGYWANGGT